MNLQNEGLSDFSIILLGIMLLIVVYATIGALFEHKHVLINLSSFITFMRPEWEFSLEDFSDSSFTF